MVEQQLMVRHRERELTRTGRIGPTTPELSWQLVVDTTGVGGFGTDPLRQAGFTPTSIVIHGGDAVSHPDAHTYRVPKRDLAGVLDICLGQGRLTIADTLPDAAVLRAELENFRVTINIATGHDAYAAGPVEEWRVGSHDDLVLAVAVAVWLGESQPIPRLDPLIAAAWTDLPR